MEHLEKSLKKTLAKFKYDEFPDMLSVVFLDSVPWERVKRKLDFLRLDRKAKTVAELCCMMYMKTRPTKEEALKTLWTLQLYDVSIHSTRKWFGIKLKDAFPDSSPTLDDIENKLSRAYRKDLRNATVLRTIVNSCHYIMAIEEKTTKKAPKYLSPVFFVFKTDVKEPCAFYTPKLSKTYPLDCISSAAGYQDYRLLALSGDNVETLFGAVQRKSVGTVALRAPLLDIVPITQENVTDMTGYSNRRKYAMDVLPGGANLKLFTVQSENEWRGTSVLPSLKGESDDLIETSLTIQTRVKGVAVDDVLRTMICDGTIKMPLPLWLLKFAQQPRNKIKLSSHYSVHSSSGGAFERTDEGVGESNEDENDFATND